MESAVTLLFPLVFIAVVVAAIWSFVRRRRRREDLALLALNHGLQYMGEDRFGTLAEPFELFGKGDGQGVENVVWGTWQDLDIRAFDYWYYEESTDSNGHRSKTYHRFSCVLAPVDAACARLVIAPENLLTRLADHLAMGDIDFESEEFNRVFQVTCADRKFANDLVDARMMSWLLVHGREFSFETAGDRVLLATKERPPGALPVLLGTVKGFVDHVPRVVSSLYPLP